MATTNTTYLAKNHLVQRASYWPADDSGWITCDWLRIDGNLAEGAGQILGGGTLLQDWGLVGQPNQAVSSADYPQPIDGDYIRILLASPAGSVTIDGKAYSPIWYGVLHTGERTNLGQSQTSTSGSPIDSGTVSWDVVGLGDVLDRLAIFEGYEWNGSVIVNLFECPVFNDLPGGDRSASTYLVQNAMVYVHQRDSSGTPWTVRQIVDFILAAFTQPSIVGLGKSVGSLLTWSLDPSTASLLDFRAERVDLHGQTMADALNRLINPGRGLIWRVKVSGTNATLVITSTTATAVTVHGVTIPAATPAVVDLTGLDITPPIVRPDPNFYDVIMLHGARPRSTISLLFDPADTTTSLQPDGWTVTDTVTVPSTPATEQVWRRFAINSTWNGAQDTNNGYGLSNTLPGDLTGMDGSRTFGGTAPTPAGLEILRSCPCGLGFTSDVNGPPQAACVFIYASGKWTDVTERFHVIPWNEGGKTGVMLGSGVRDAATLQGLLTGTDAKLVITVGMREWAPFVLAWYRPVEDWPRDLPRILMKRLPHIEMWTVLQDTAKQAASDGSTLNRQSSDLITRDDRPQAYAALAQLVARYGGVGGSASWTQRGTLVTGDTLAPGTFIDKVYGQPVNGTITRRTWHFDEANYGTSFSVERLPISVESA